MNDRHFYLTLPSNSSVDYFGPQKPCSYKTKLEHVVSLDPELWEVGLAELDYPRSWNNVPKCVFRITYPLRRASSDAIRRGDYTVLVNVRFGGTRYVSGRQLVRDLHAAVQESTLERDAGAISLRYDEIGHRVIISVKENFKFWVQDVLGETLGLNSRAASKTTLRGGLQGYELPRAPQTGLSVTSSPYTVNVDRLIPTVYVYCSIVRQQYVGDSYVQLLRYVAVPETPDDVSSNKFNNVHYGNLQTGTFESLEVKLTDSRGIPIDFKHGDVIVKLHFRKKKP